MHFIRTRRTLNLKLPSNADGKGQGNPAPVCLRVQFKVSESYIYISQGCQTTHSVDRICQHLIYMPCCMSRR